MLTRRVFGLTVAISVFALAGPLLADADKASWKYRFEPVEGITAAGQPKKDGLMELAEAGYVAVIDLRGADENRGLDEKAVVEALGMEYVSLPIENKAALNFDNAEKLDDILDNYDKPVLVHCGSSNRAGALLALRQKANGAEDEDALAFGRSAGMTSLEETVQARFAER